VTARVDRGTFRGVAQPGGQPVRVVTPGGQTTHIVARGEQPARFRVRRRGDGQMEVAVLEGEARVRGEEGEVALRQGQVVDVREGQAGTPAKLLDFPELVAPGVDARLAPGEPVALRWKPVEGAEGYRVQLASSLSFQPRLVDRVVQGTRLEVPELAADEEYIWRVSSVDAAGHQGEFGFARRFSLRAEAGAEAAGEAVARRLVSPPSGARIEAVGRSPAVTFRWEGEPEKAAAEGDGEGQSKYLLVLARDRELRQRVLRRQTAAERVRVRGIRQGTYYWGVFALSGDGERRPLFARSWRLVVARRAPPSVQVPRSIEWQ
jgi:hypothetical protein